MSKNNNFEPKESKLKKLVPDSYWNDGRIPATRVEVNNSNDTHDYYGRFEDYENGHSKSFEIWVGKPGSKLSAEEVGKNEPDSIKKWLEREAPRAKKITKETGNINDFYSSNKVEYSPKRNVIDAGSLVKENQELKQQLAEVQKQLAEVLAELKNLKGKNNDNLVSELTQIQAKNQQLISTDNISVSQVQEQVQKPEALLNEVKSVSFVPNSNEKENSVMTYVIGGSFILAISGILGLLLLRKRNKT